MEKKYQIKQINVLIVGYRIKRSKDNKVKSILKTKKKIIAIICISFVLIMGLFTYKQFKTYSLTEDEKMVLSIVDKYRNSLKNPNSMQIFEIRKYDKFVLIDTSGQNGFGGNTRDVVSYSFDGSYLGSDKDADQTVTKYTSLKDKTQIIIAQAIRVNWKTRTDYTLIDKDKILKNLSR